MSLYFERTGPEPLGLATSYKVVMDEEYTVSDFIKEVTQVESQFYVCNNQGLFDFIGSKKRLKNRLSCNRSKITKYTDEYDECKVLSAHAHGGWSAYDFYLCIGEVSDRS